MKKNLKKTYKSAHTLKVYFIQRLDNDHGSASVVMTVALTVLMAVSVIGVDVGLITFERAKLSNALDAAALAASQELPESESDAISVANAYLITNGIDLNDVTITVDNDNKGIELVSTRNLSTIFGPLVDINNVNIRGRAKVRVGPVSEVKSGIRPLAIESQSLEYGAYVDLKLNASENYHGNFGALALGGSGALNYRNNLLFGYSGTLKIGDVIYTEPGNMTSVINPLKLYLCPDNSTFENFDRTSRRLWVIPVVDSLEVSGSSAVTIVGFAEFFIEDIGKQSGQTKIQGRFIQYSGGGIIDDSAADFGLYGMKLVQ